MTLGQQLRFMFSTLHGGAVNLTLHLLSLPVLLVGLAYRRPALIVAAALLEILGHAYNYAVRFDGEQRRQAIRVFPLQAMLSVVVFGLLMALFGWFGARPS
jgi:hypothetical protein